MQDWRCLPKLVVNRKGIAPSVVGEQIDHGSLRCRGGGGRDWPLILSCFAGQAVADALLSQQIARLRWVRLQFPPQARHEHTQVMRLVHAMRAPHFLHEEMMR